MKRARKFTRFGLRELMALLLVCGLLFAMQATTVRESYLAYQARLRGVENVRLLRAAAEGNRDEARMAISAGADVNASTNGETALGYAVMRNDLPLVNLLLDSGADPNGRFREEGASEGSGTTPLGYVVRTNEIIVARTLLDAGADPNMKLVRSPPTSQFPLLDLCIEKDHLKMLDLLVERSAKTEAGGRSAMDSAVRLAKSTAGDVLIKHGADYTPREAVAFNRLDDVKRMINENPALLQERFPPLYYAKEGQNPTLLGIALRFGYRKMAQHLIEAGAPLDVLEYQGSTLLHAAAIGGDVELVKLLIALGLDINARDDYQDTPLHEAIYRDHQEAVEALLAAGANPKSHSRNNGRETALQSTTVNKNPRNHQAMTEAEPDASSKPISSERTNKTR